MRLQVALHLFLLAFMLTKVSSSKQMPVSPKFCAECAEEVWEEIPCEEVDKTTLPPIIPPSSTVKPYHPKPTLPPVTPTPRPPAPCNKCNTPKPTLPPSPPPPPVTTKRPPIYTPKRYPITPIKKPMPTTTPSPESSDAYKKCYCECKNGCKEFCRKVVVYPDAEKQITQLSKTSQPLGHGQLEVKHLLERNYVPTSVVYNPNILPPVLPNPNPNPDNYADNSLPKIISPQPPILPPQPPILPPQLPNYPTEPPILPPQPPILPPHPPKRPILPPVYVETNAGNGNYGADSFGISIEDLQKLLNSEQSYANMIPELSQPQREYQNLYASPLPLQPAQPANPHLYQPQQEISDLDAKTSASGAGTINYKSSIAQSYNEETNSKPALPAPDSKYENSLSPYNNNNLPNADPSLDSYFRDILYSNSAKTQGHGYSLSF